MKLTERNWKTFEIGDIFIIQIRGNKKNIPTGSYISRHVLGKGKVPRVRVTSLNNGIGDFTKDIDQPSFRKKSNFISVSFLGSVFYHPYCASLDMKVHSLQLKNKSLTLPLAMFLATAIKNSFAGITYGNQLSSKDLVHRKLVLPVNEKKQPDYQFMADYEQALIANKRQQCLEYISNVLHRITPVEKIEALDHKHWKIFRIGQLFDSITRPAARSKSQYNDGNIPFIASGASLNGAVTFCQPQVNEILDKSGCITVSPVDGSAFYQPIDFLGRGGGGSSIIMLRSTRLNLYNGIFIAKAINHTTSKYQYGHMATSNGIPRDQIWLPVKNNDGNTPDYEYMEQYIQNVMIKKYQQYIKYLK